jgi:SAM-dependent methyltransferase
MRGLATELDLNDDELVSAYDELPLWAAPFGMRLLDTVRLGKNLRLLDVGFGTGFPILELAMRLGESSRAYGVDPWVAGIRRTRFKIERRGITNVEIVEGVAEKLPFEDGFFDRVVSNNGINNVQDMALSLREIFRVSRRGAELVFTMNLEETMLEFYAVYRGLLGERGLAREAAGIRDHIYARRKPLAEVTGLVRAAGFEIDATSHDSFTFRYADGTAMLRHFFIRLAFLASWKAIVPEALQTDLFAELERRLNALAERQGELQLRIPFVTLDCWKR